MGSWSAWPPVVNLPGLCVPLERGGEWRHEEGLTARDGCMDARPAA